ncbi:MAG: CobW family GTP-binding protein [Candidatus Binatia bacterium]
MMEDRRWRSSILYPRTMKVPLTLITGPLGSGKTTLLRHILDTVPKRIAILMNEFGEIAIDSKIVEGKNIRIAELAGGCVCCSLLGEFEAAVGEIIETARPEVIVVETTGVAEPDALVFDIQDNLPQVRLDGVVAVADADALVRYPQLGRTTRMQIGEADLVILNKTDIVSEEELARAKEKLSEINRAAPVVRSRYCRIDSGLLFGIGRERRPKPPEHLHQPEFESFSHITTRATFVRSRFEQFAERLGDSAYRAKGFIRFPEGTYLFNFVAGRWELEPFPQDETALVFIGERGKLDKDKILAELKKCEQ